MRKTLLSLLMFGVLTFNIYAQNYNLTLQVDMRAVIVSPDGVHVAGDLQMPSGAAANWDPAITALSDANGDGIYDITLNLPAGTYAYKFVNGNAWGLDEGGGANPAIPAPCNVGGNRQVVVAADMTVPVHAFNSCDPNPAGNPVIFQVNIGAGTVTGNVTVAGDFQMAAGFPANWDNTTVIMDLVPGTNRYQKTVWINSTTPDTFEYKFINSGSNWENVPSGCAVPASGNRQLIVANANGIVTPDVCFSDCAPCPTGIPDSVYVKFQVDMSNQDYPYPPFNTTIDNIVSVAGAFQGWSPGNTVLTDANSDKIYDVVVKVQKNSSSQYKFLNGNAWGKDESVPAACNVGGNREFNTAGTATNDTMVLPVVCFGECSQSCTPVGPPINVTFRLDLSNELNYGGGPFVAGTFQTPTTWQKTASPLTELDPVNAPRIFSYTQMVKPNLVMYKYWLGPSVTMNGDSTAENADFLTLGCGATNPVGTPNRLLDLYGVTQDTVLPIVVFNSCDISTVSIEEDLNNGGSFVIAPNPTNNVASISFGNKNNIAYNITITNITGQVVYSKTNVQTDNVIVRKADIGSGMFFVTVRNAKGEVAARKLIIE